MDQITFLKAIKKETDLQVEKTFAELSDHEKVLLLAAATLADKDDAKIDLLYDAIHFHNSDPRAVEKVRAIDAQYR